MKVYVCYCDYSGPSRVFEFEGDARDWCKSFRGMDYEEMEVE